MNDFRDEYPGYLHNTAIVELLGGLELSPDPRAVADNARSRWASVVEAGFLPEQELELFDEWRDALCGLRSTNS